MLNSRVEESLAPVVARWAGQDKEMLWPLFPQIVTGQSVCEADLATCLHRNAEDLGIALRASLAEVDSIGRITELFGITQQPTLHRIEVGKNTLFSCCALVAHAVPAIFGKSATIVSTDTVNGGETKIRISDKMELQDVQPQASVGTLVDGEPGELLTNPRQNFCCHVKHFTDANSAAEFCGEDSRRYLVPIEEFHVAAQQLFHRVWG